MADDVQSSPADTPPGGPRADDDQLRELGYRPELRRALGGMSSFALQFSTACFSGAIVVAFLVGFGQVGPLSLWTFAGATVLQVVVAFCIAELCSAYPLAGGVYQVVTRQAGRFLGWQVGWMIQIAHFASVGLGAVGLTPLICNWFGVERLSHWQTVGVSALIILATTLLNLLRVKLVALLNNVGVVSELLASGAIVVGCGAAFLFFGQPHRPMGFLFTDAGVVQGSVVLPLIFSCLLSAFIVSGFDVSGTAGEETHNASRSVPVMAVSANILTLIVGSLVLFVLMLGISSVDGTLNSASPVKYILAPILGTPFATAIEVLAVFSLFVNGMVVQLAGARVLWAQGRDGAFVGARLLKRLSRERVPVTGVLVSGAIALLFIVYSAVFQVLAAILAVTWALSYAASTAVGIRSRIRGSLPERSFTLRGGPFWYIVATIWSLMLVAFLIYQDPVKVGCGTLGVIVIGVVLYFTAHARDERAPEEAVTPPRPVAR
ncbi:APC family permease [Streptomyces iranensis]|uniref:Amino acid permease-associated region n=1 Tax=Streptomyces iranensis TaxID=576784 RepID=A0A061ABC4_9ACTN|nr:APC family permease [Streptomyces iranensis]MBP2063652.1 amino acid transporter [Streptomyces iranensis]CDR17756.1 amino acid permease-associated region [Streptomyces iranensis]